MSTDQPTARQNTEKPRIRHDFHSTNLRIFSLTSAAGRRYWFTRPPRCTGLRLGEHLTFEEALDRAKEILAIGNPS